MELTPETEELIEEVALILSEAAGRPFYEVEPLVRQVYEELVRSEEAGETDAVQQPLKARLTSELRNKIRLTH